MYIYRRIHSLGAWEREALADAAKLPESVVVLLNDMKLVRAEPESCYLIGRRRDRGPLGGAIKLWGDLPTAKLEMLAAELAKKLEISPVVLESSLCDWNK